jgi:hypothetical protein
MPFCDLFVGSFVLVQPSNPIVCHVYMRRAESDVVRDQENENYRKVYVQWWVPMRKGAKNDEELYHNCWSNKWKCNNVNSKQWVEISSITFSFSTRSNATVNSIININVTRESKVKINLDVANNNSSALKLQIKFFMNMKHKCWCYFMVFIVGLVFSICLCTFIEKIINVYHFYKQFNVSAFCQYGHCLF